MAFYISCLRIFFTHPENDIFYYLNNATMFKKSQLMKISLLKMLLFDLLSLILHKCVSIIHDNVLEIITRNYMFNK